MRPARQPSGIPANTERWAAFAAFTVQPASPVSPPLPPLARPLGVVLVGRVSMGRRNWGGSRWRFRLAEGAARGTFLMVSAPEALTFSCPNCGAPVGSADRACGYCHIALATRRCGHCFDHSPATAQHCATCGRELGLEAVAEVTELACPACRASLEALHEAEGTLFDCAGCGGHFVEHALLRALIEQRSRLAQSSALAPARSAARSSVLAQKVTYRPCARCGAMMHRKNFGGASGVIVDVCTLHGIWFDAGELPNVLSFVERGGLERARKLEEERARRARVEQRAASSKPFTTLGAADLGAEGAGVKELALLEFITNLLSTRF